MGLSYYNIKRWYKMLLGKSEWHVNQDVGKCFSTSNVSGYYNNLTEKVSCLPYILSTEELPILLTEQNKKVHSPVAIFQYGLGAYDLYLMSNDSKYYVKFLQCCKWALDHIDEDGRWANFFYIYPNNPYGAMAQGEGVSLLIRAYIQTSDNTFLQTAKKALDYMLLPIIQGGTTQYDQKQRVILKEYTHKDVVLNGWIFAWWGLYDYVKITNDSGYYKEMLDTSLKSIVEYLPLFDSLYWSYYSLDKKIASPFYHNLHIAQMRVMHIITEDPIFAEYANRWEKHKRNYLFKTIAFCHKAIQKIIER